MKKSYVVTAIVAVVLYFVWRRYGDNIKSTISNVTA